MKRISPISILMALTVTMIIATAVFFIRQHFDPYGNAIEAYIQTGTVDISFKGINRKLFEIIFTEFMAMLEMYAAMQGMILQGNEVAAVINIFIYLGVLFSWNRLDVAISDKLDVTDSVDISGTGLFFYRRLTGILQHGIGYISMYLISLISYGMSFLLEKFLVKFMSSNSEVLLISGIALILILMFTLFKNIYVFLMITLERGLYLFPMFILFMVLNFLVPMDAVLTASFMEIIKRPTWLLSVLILLVYDRLWVRKGKAIFYQQI